MVLYYSHVQKQFLMWFSLWWELEKHGSHIERLNPGKRQGITIFPNGNDNVRRQGHPEDSEIMHFHSWPVRWQNRVRRTDISVHCRTDDDVCAAGSVERKKIFKLLPSISNVMEVMEISVLCLCCCLNLDYFFLPFERLKTCSTEGWSQSEYLCLQRSSRNACKN